MNGTNKERREKGGADDGWEGGMCENVSLQ